MTKQRLFVSLSVIALAILAAPSVAADRAEILINRKKQTLDLITGDSKRPQLHCDVDIGRGGLRSKRSMADEITPTGSFLVDLILCKEPDYDRISEQARARFLKDKRFCAFVRDKEGLNTLYKSMSALDFDDDGKPDHAYGDAYIGLQPVSPPNAVTGPKLTRYKGKPYWYSIAIHGTPDGKTGKPSGGCIHVERNMLMELVRQVLINTPVQIRD